MKKLVLDNKEVKRVVSKICREISGGSWRPDYVVGITRGGLTPAVMISHWFNSPMETLKVSLRNDGQCESNLWMAEDAFGYHRTDNPEPPTSNISLRKNILVVDDINDSGATFNWLMKDWQSGCLPKDVAWKEIWNNNVKFAVLVDNLSSNCQIKMDFCGMEINKSEDDVWVDFPWEDWWTK
jgi:hypoxanthine phosphoribosyltransferase